MVRASRNVSNGRRALQSSAGQDFRAWADWTYPGESPEGVLAAVTRSMGPQAGRDEPPGARLDGQPWARNWASFLKAVFSERDSSARQFISNAWTERVPSEGGFLVPETLRQQVLAYMTRAVVWPRAMVLPMDALRVGLPVLDNPTQASGTQALGGLQFSIIEPGKNIPASSPDFSKAVLEANKAAALLQNVPNELVDDAGAAFSDLLSRVIAMGFEWWTDDQFISQGTGAGQPEALLNAPAALTVSRNPPSGFHAGHADVVAMLKALHPASKASATWLIGNDLFGELLELYEVVGTAPGGQEVPPPGTLKFNSLSGCWELMGVPAAATDHQPAAGTQGDLMLCDLGLYAIGERQELLVERSAKGSGFASNTSNFRIKARLDARLWPQQACTLANGTQASPLVVLQ